MQHRATSTVKRAREQPAEEDDWVHSIDNDGSVACGVFLLLARRHVSGDVHPTQDLAMCALHMVWASVDDQSPRERARQSFLRLTTSDAVSLTNVRGNATVPSPWPAGPAFRSLSSICHGPRANIIVRIDTEALTGVTEIGNAFLLDCSSLRLVNLRGVLNVARIGGDFLSGCSELKAVDLVPLARVTQVGEDFLADCGSLSAIDLAPMSQLTTLSPEFLFNCSSLQSVDCPPLRSVTTIESGFLEGCTALQELATAVIDVL